MKAKSFNKKHEKKNLVEELVIGLCDGKIA
jgi:hypothetical protein